MKVTDEMRKGQVVNVDGEEITVHRIDADINGNPRYVVHFLSLDIKPADYGKIPGLTKYRAKWFGGGYVFQSHYVREDLQFLKQIVVMHYENCVLK